MNIFNSLERVTGAMDRAQEHWRRRQQEEKAAPEAPRPALTIALTREAGVPGTSIAREVGAKLGWPVYDHELLEKIAHEMGLRVDLLESVDERRKSWLLESVQALSSGAFVSESSYVHHLVQTILSLGTHGECIIVGRGAAAILPRETTLRVRLLGELEDRIEATRRRLNITRQEAARWVEETDRERRRFIQDHFQTDPADPRHFDMTLNTSRWSISDCASLIITGLRLLQAQRSTPHASEATAR
jgi:cytidylate kinase